MNSQNETETTTEATTLVSEVKLITVGMLCLTVLCLYSCEGKVTIRLEIDQIPPKEQKP